MINDQADSLLIQQFPDLSYQIKGTERFLDKTHPLIQNAISHNYIIRIYCCFYDHHALNMHACAISGDI